MFSHDCLFSGILADDPLCQERQVDGENPCCVQVVCAADEEEQEKEEDEIFIPPPSALETKPIVDNDKNIEFLQITPTSIQVQFPGITGGNLMYVEDRIFKGSRGEIPWENAIILEGNKIFTLTGLRPGTTYRLRWQAPDAQYPDVEVATQPLNRKSPKVIVTGKSFDSITLSFDHFAPEDYQHEYVAMVNNYLD